MKKRDLSGRFIQTRFYTNDLLEIDIQAIHKKFRTLKAKSIYYNCTRELVLFFFKKDFETREILERQKIREIRARERYILSIVLANPLKPSKDALKFEYLVRKGNDKQAYIICPRCDKAVRRLYFYKAYNTNKQRLWGCRECFKLGYASQNYDKGLNYFASICLPHYQSDFIDADEQRKNMRKIFKESWSDNYSEIYQKRSQREYIKYQ